MTEKYGNFFIYFVLMEKSLAKNRAKTSLIKEKYEIY